MRIIVSAICAIPLWWLVASTGNYILIPAILILQILAGADVSFKKSGRR